MADLNRKVGEMNYDGLITDLNPPVQVHGGTIAKLSAKATYMRGTILAKDGDGKLVILGTADSVPDCILCDDTEIGTTADVNAAVYTAGCFDPDKVTVKDAYDITEEDRDELRKRNIVFRSVFDAN